MANFIKDEIIFKLIIIGLLVFYLFNVYNDHHFEIVIKNSESKSYTVEKIGINKDLGISYNIYDGGVMNNYQNKYFIEYKADFYQDETGVRKVKKGDKTPVLPGDDGVSKLVVNIKNQENKVIYKTNDIVNDSEVQKLLKNNRIETYAMYLSKNKDNELILNIPTKSKKIEYINACASVKFIDPYYTYYGLKDSKVIEYNFKSKNISIVNHKITSLEGNIHNSELNYNNNYNERCDYLRYSLGNNTTMKVDGKNANKGYSTIVFYNGYEYYLAHKDAKIFKVFPELVKYLKKHHDKDQIVFNFKDSMSEKEIIEYLK